MRKGECFEMYKLGSVVYVRESYDQYMVISRFVPELKDNKEVYYDYLLVKLPIGIGDDAGTVVVNDEEIEELIFEGYADEEEQIYIDEIKAWIESEKLVRGVTR